MSHEDFDRDWLEAEDDFPTAALERRADGADSGSADADHDIDDEKASARRKRDADYIWSKRYPDS